MVWFVILLVACVGGSENERFRASQQINRMKFMHPPELSEFSLPDRAMFRADPVAMELLSEIPMWFYEALVEHFNNPWPWTFHTAIQRFSEEMRIIPAKSALIGSSWLLRCVMGSFYAGLRKLEQSPCTATESNTMKLSDRMKAELEAFLSISTIDPVWDPIKETLWHSPPQLAGIAVLINPYTPAEIVQEHLLDPGIKMSLTFIRRTIEKARDRSVFPLAFHRELALARFIQPSSLMLPDLMTQEEKILGWTPQISVIRNSAWESSCALILWNWFNKPQGQPPCFVDVTGILMILNPQRRARLLLTIVNEH